VSGHGHATPERPRAPAVVVLVQETTLLDDGTLQPQVGLGPVKITVRQEYLWHPTVAFPPARVHLGVGGRTIGQRPEQPVAQQRKSKPMTEKERSRGLAGDQGAWEVQPACPATLGVHMAAREGASQVWCVDVLRREPRQRAEGISRATETRRLAPGAPPRDMWAERQPPGALGPLPIDLAATRVGHPDRSPSQCQPSQ
jgi:hypothetical protein